MNFLPGFFACALAAIRFPAPQQPSFYDQPSFIVAGVTDGAAQGGHGSDTVLRSSEQLAKATALLGNIDRRANVEIARAYQQAAEKDPSEHNLFDWGAELLSHGAAVQAAEIFTRGVRAFPRSTRMLLGLAAAQYWSGSYEKAAENFFAATDVNPSDPQPYLVLARVRTDVITESDGYRERMARFARLAPNNARANFYYAVCLQEHEPGKAEILLKRALELDPTLADAHVQLGIIYTSQKNFESAIAAFQEAIAINPKLEEPHYRLAQAYTRIGEKEKAREQFAIHDRLLKQSAAEVEQERRQAQQFVIELRAPR